MMSTLHHEILSIQKIITYIHYIIPKVMVIEVRRSGHGMIVRGEMHMFG
jgi:hypothetical protein